MTQADPYKTLQDLAKAVADSPIGSIGVTEYEMAQGDVRGAGYRPHYEDD